MTLTPGDDRNETSRQRTRDQVELLREAHGPAIIVDTEDAADFTFICSSEHVLVSSGEDVGRLQDYFGRRIEDPDDDVFEGVGVVASEQPRDGLFVRYVLPTRRDSVPGDRSLLVTLDELEQDPALDPDLARPDHVVHICPRGSLCPADEPAETGSPGPWPAVNTVDPDAGLGVRVVVIDTGWYDPTRDPEDPAQDLPWPWLDGVAGEPEPAGVRDPGGRLRAYAGHGTFVAGVVRAMAPKCSVEVLGLPVDHDAPGGGVFESDMVPQLDAALALEPHLINLSAGCPTRQGRPARAFENWWADISDAQPDRDLVLVAAAGNNASAWQFWPASFDWAVGVGSLDRDGEISSFSNYGDSVDVFALGRNVVNAFPNGTHVCHESPDRGDERVFDRWLARWSGTSFASPNVTGRIAAAMTGPPARTAREARDHVLAAPRRLPALTATRAPGLAT